jgi:hypothetical protein
VKGFAAQPRPRSAAWIRYATAVAALTIASAGFAQTAAKKPNILVIWGDDIGRDNISAYSMGIMGYQTPNIDRLAKEGALFTDSYAQQSCTAGRASFILGEHPFRTGLLTIGMPGSPQGIPVQEKLRNFLVTLPRFPFQKGSSLNAANINYDSLAAMQAMKRLLELETLSPPQN